MLGTNRRTKFRTPRIAAAAAVLAVAAIAAALPVVRGTAPALAGLTTTGFVDASERNHRVDLTASAPATVPLAQRVRRPRTHKAPPTLPEPLNCLNSHNPLCGSFRWSTDPGPNQPLELEVAYTPEHPKAGDEVVVTVTATDPDAAINYRWFSSGDGGAVALPSAWYCDRPFGTWIPPKPSAGHQIFTFTHVYEEAATYRMWIDVASENAAEPGNDCVDPYGSEISRQIEIEVGRAHPHLRDLTPGTDLPGSSGSRNL